MLTESAIELYHVPGDVQEIVKSYFGWIQIRVTVDDFTPSRQRIEKEIVTTGLQPPVIHDPVCNGNVDTDQIYQKGDKRAKD